MGATSVSNPPVRQPSGSKQRPGGVGVGETGQRVQLGLFFSPRSAGPPPLPLYFSPLTVPAGSRCRGAGDASVCHKQVGACPSAFAIPATDLHSQRLFGSTLKHQTRKVCVRARGCVACGAQIRNFGPPNLSLSLPHPTTLHHPHTHAQKPKHQPKGNPPASVPSVPRPVQRLGRYHSVLRSCTGGLCAGEANSLSYLPVL